MIKTVLKIEGMMCGMCEAHICDTIRKAVPDAKKARASHGQAKAPVQTDAPVDTAALQAAIDATGYRCLAVETAEAERKGWFGWK